MARIEGDSEGEDALKQREPREACQIFPQDYGDMGIDELHIGRLTIDNPCGFKNQFGVFQLNPDGPP